MNVHNNLNNLLRQHDMHGGNSKYSLVEGGKHISLYKGGDEQIRYEKATQTSAHIR